MRAIAAPVLLAAALLVVSAAACAAPATVAGGARGAARPIVLRHGDVLAVRLGAGPAGLSTWITRRAGWIARYRLSAPAGSRVRATLQIPGLTVPLPIGAGAPATSARCAGRGRRLLCTAREEGCPMPAARWRLRLRKLHGPAGTVRISFTVRQPERR